jgi:flagellar hook-basal body complex protein FliE
MAIEPIQPTGAVGPLSGASAATPSTEGARAVGNFKKVFADYMQDVNGLQAEADKAVRDLMVGKAENLHEVIAAVSEADLSFRLMMQIRNRLVEAYQQIMRMQV